MAKGYWIARIDVSDPDRYVKYVEADAVPFEKFGARFPVRGGRFDSREGKARSRNIVIEFDSYDTALACYRSPEYQTAKAFRDGACEADFVIIEGYEDERPTSRGNTPDENLKTGDTMAKGYWIARVDVHDGDKYKNYVAANAEPFAKYGARFLIRGGPFENPEGTSRERNVVIEFPSYSNAVECYNSPEYQAARAERDGASDADLVIIEGYDG